MNKKSSIKWLGSCQILACCWFSRDLHRWSWGLQIQRMEFNRSSGWICSLDNNSFRMEPTQGLNKRIFLGGHKAKTKSGGGVFCKIRKTLKFPFNIGFFPKLLVMASVGEPSSNPNLRLTLINEWVPYCYWTHHPGQNLQRKQVRTRLKEFGSVPYLLYIEQNLEY